MIGLLVVVGLAVTFLSKILGSAWFVHVQEWYSKPCLVDANGDGVLDVAGLAGVSPESARLRLVDGATGKPLWSGRTYSSSAHLVCLSPRFFGIDDVDFRLHLFPARTPNDALAVAMSDRVDKVGLGEDCVAIRFTNRQETSISFSGTTVSRCDTTGLIEYWGIRKSSDHTTITSNGTVYSLTEREPRHTVPHRFCLERSWPNVDERAACRPG